MRWAEFKQAAPELAGVGEDRLVRDPDRREGFCIALQKKIGWRPEEPYHLFAVDVHDVTYIRYGEAREVVRWNPAKGMQRL